MTATSDPTVTIKDPRALDCVRLLHRIEVQATSFSANDRLHRRRRDELVQEWRGTAQQLTRAKLGPRAPKLGLAHIYVFVHTRTATRFDPINAAPAGKAAIDGMVLAGLLVDDNDEHLLGPDYRRGRPVKMPEGQWRLQFDVWVPA